MSFQDEEKEYENEEKKSMENFADEEKQVQEETRRTKD